MRTENEEEQQQQQKGRREFAQKRTMRNAVAHNSNGRREEDLDFIRMR